MNATLLLALSLTGPSFSEGPTGLTCLLQRAATPDPALQVRILFPGDPDGSTDLRVTAEWGGVVAAALDLTDLAVFTSQGEPLELAASDATHWRVEHPAAAPLELRYSIPANPHQETLDPETNRRPILNERIFHAVGELFLVTPEHLDGRRLEHSVEWAGFDDGDGLACSFGVGLGPHHFEASLDQLRQSIFLGGDVDLVEREVWGSPLWLAVQRHPWGFEVAQLAELAATIVDVERAFFEDFERPFYLISMIPVGSPSPGSLSFGGTGLTNSFSLAVQPGFDLERGGSGHARMSSLLAHELFHDWNGIILQRVDPEELCYWFSEGFTEFYTRRLQLRGGLIDLDDYVASLNDSLREYYTSAARGARNERVLESFWTDASIRDLPYRRGDVVAMILDHALRARSGGERSLDDLMRTLVARGATGWKVGTEEFLEIVERETSVDVAAALRAIIVDGALPVLEFDTFAPCLALRMEEAPQYDLGFDIEASLAERRVRGVREDGPAFAAGLRDGDPLRGWSYQRGDTTQPVRFEIESEGGSRDVSYRPVWGTVLTPQFALEESALDSCELL